MIRGEQESLPNNATRFQRTEATLDTGNVGTFQMNGRRRKRHKNIAGIQLYNSNRYDYQTDFDQYLLDPLDH